MIQSHYRLNRPRVGLALSGGAARGIAHVGVLRALEENAIPIDAIAGASAGALVGGLYASALRFRRLNSWRGNFAGATPGDFPFPAWVCNQTRAWKPSSALTCPLPVLKN
jgi:predicted acylesterase/phospholipase RssA